MLFFLFSATRFKMLLIIAVQLLLIGKRDGFKNKIKWNLI